MAKRICKRRSQEIDFPKDCQGCEFLKPRGKIQCCTYKGQEERQESKKSCCH
ncbi:hypothetical protein KKG44_03520 [Patescibacteria group bacterium]|nr:hypothetical protein [Patescibacteria group bacterium]MBU2544416.1 hypothetical protein [Patescibacteria group bacterium]